MKRYIYTLLILCSFVHGVHAQQQGIFSQFTNNTLPYNPAFAGLEKMGIFTMGNRIQWAGFNEAPIQQLVNFNTRLSERKVDSILPYGLPISDNDLYYKIAEPQPTVRYTPHGLGATLQRDTYGPFTKVQLTAGYAYHIPLNSALTLSLGAGLGVALSDIDEGAITVTDPSDPLYQDYQSQNVRGIHLDGNVGALLYSNKFYLGYSANQLFMNRPFSGRVESSEYQLRYHHMFTGGYIYRPSTHVEVVPNFNVFAVRSAPGSAAIGVKTRFYKKFWMAVNYRIQALNGRIGLTLLNRIMLNYSYEMPIGELRGNSNGTHEIGLGILFNNSKNPVIQW